MRNPLLLLLFSIVTLVAYCNNPTFSTAGFYSLKNSPREVFNFDSGWKLYKGDVANAPALDFDDTRWSVVSLPNGIEYLPEYASGRINYQEQKLTFTEASSGKIVIRASDDAANGYLYIDNFCIDNSTAISQNLKTAGIDYQILSNLAVNRDIQVRVSTTEKATLAISDLNGRNLVVSEVSGCWAGGSNPLAPGVYLVIVKIDNKKVTKRLVFV